ncbi:hypothetical protein MED16_gp52 [Pantoea phage vB_PagS_MED16]|nr:hypothetical protein MED16_gp52 [Pantoea phage vB_PagS_MED16]
MSDQPLSARKVQVKFKRMPRAERLCMTQDELARYRELANAGNKQGGVILPTQDRKMIDDGVKTFDWSQTHYQRGMK